MVEQSEILTKSRRLLFRQLIRLDCNVQMSYFFPFFHSLFGLVTKGLRIVSTDPFGNFSIWKTIYIYIYWLGWAGLDGGGLETVLMVTMVDEFATQVSFSYYLL